MGAKGAGPPRQVRDIDWGHWSPVDVATLLFVVRGGEILLIRKKRGLGAGKINAPGGRLEPGERPEEAAVREVLEEVCVTPIGVTGHGELSFQFTDGYSLHVFVFRADDCRGEPHETAEAKPMWVPLDRIPYGEMWADDAIWLPLLLRGEAFRGRFLFDGDAMLDHEVASPGAESADATAPGSVIGAAQAKLRHT